jgi:hypothetical protein
VDSIHISLIMPAVLKSGLAPCIVLLVAVAFICFSPWLSEMLQRRSSQRVAAADEGETPAEPAPAPTPPPSKLKRTGTWTTSFSDRAKPRVDVWDEDLAPSPPAEVGGPSGAMRRIWLVRHAQSAGKSS